MSGNNHETGRVLPEILVIHILLGSNYHQLIIIEAEFEITPWVKTILKCSFTGCIRLFTFDGVQDIWQSSLQISLSNSSCTVANQVVA